MKLTTVEAIIADADRLQDILEAFDWLGPECDYLDSDEIHYSITTSDNGYIQIRYNFMIGTCYISTDEDEDKELILRFSLTKRYISD